MDGRWIPVSKMDGDYVHLKEGWKMASIFEQGILQQPLQHRTVQRLHEQLVECLNVVVAIFLNNYEHYYFHCSRSAEFQVKSEPF